MFAQSAKLGNYDTCFHSFSLTFEKLMILFISLLGSGGQHGVQCIAALSLSMFNIEYLDFLYSKIIVFWNLVFFHFAQ